MGERNRAVRSFASAMLASVVILAVPASARGSPSKMATHLLELSRRSIPLPDCPHTELHTTVRGAGAIRAVWYRCSEINDSHADPDERGHVLAVYSGSPERLTARFEVTGENHAYVTSLEAATISEEQFLYIEAESGGSGSTQQFCLLGGTARGLRCLVPAGVERAATRLRRRGELFGCNTWRSATCPESGRICLRENLFDPREGDGKFGSTAYAEVVLGVKGDRLVVEHARRVPPPK